MLGAHSPSHLQLAPVNPPVQHSRTGKVVKGLIMLVVLAALAKLLSIWGHDYLIKAQDNLCARLWLNEDRGMS